MSESESAFEAEWTRLEQNGTVSLEFREYVQGLWRYIHDLHSKLGLPSPEMGTRDTELDRLTAAVDACLDNQEELHRWLQHGLPTGYDLERKAEEQFQLTNRLRAVRGRPPQEPIVEWVSVEDCRASDA